MKKIAILAYTAREDAVHWAQYAAERLINEGCTVYLDEGLADVVDPELLVKCTTCSASHFAKYVDMAITFGGDGTLLGAARVLIGTDIPIMGVNVGKLGFLAEYPVSTLDDSIMEVIKGNYRIVDRSTLAVTVNDLTDYALNEVLIDQATAAKLLEVRAFVNEHHVADYRADGVLVSTPTGSTAYSLAAGGPIIAPSSSVLSITPVSPHTLTLRPLIIQDDSEVRFTIMHEDGEANVVADGHQVARMKLGDVAVIRKGEHIVKLIKRADSNYYDLLREKLLWSADATKKQS